MMKHRDREDLPDLSRHAANEELRKIANEHEQPCPVKLSINSAAIQLMQIKEVETFKTALEAIISQVKREERDRVLELAEVGIHKTLRIPQFVNNREYTVAVMGLTENLMRIQRGQG